AREHLGILLQQSPGNAAYEFLFGNCEEVAKEPARAADHYAKAIRLDPKRIEAYVRLAGVLETDQQALAEKTLDEMVKANSDSFQAYLARSRYRQKHGRLARAAEDVDRAQKLAPKEVDVLLAVAEIYRAQKKDASARQALERAIELHPKEVSLYHMLALLELTGGQPRKAVDLLRKSATLPWSDQQLWTGANLYIDAKELGDAEQLIARLHEGSFSWRPVAYLEGRVLFGRERWLEASRKFEEAVPLLL